LSKLTGWFDGEKTEELAGNFWELTLADWSGWVSKCGMAEMLDLFKFLFFLIK